MDAHDIFRKLSYGAKFNTKITASDKVSSNIDVKHVHNVNNRIDSVKKNVSVKPEPYDEFILLDSIKAESDCTKVKIINKKKDDRNNHQRDQEQESINRIRKINRISVVGKKVPNPVETFDQLIDQYNVMPQIVDNLKLCGYTAPTPIQMQAIPVMLKGRQILGCAPTGSGKTATFLVPIINNLAEPSKNGFRSLIVCPTRELARQIFRECNQLTEGTGLITHLISKVSQKHNAQSVNFTKKFDILITTPNRLIYLLKQDKPINLKSVEWLIVDESDKLFEVGVRGFREQLADIYRACDSANLKRAMFSATHTYHVAKWCKKNLKGLIFVSVGHRNTTTDLVEQKLLFVGNEHGKLIAFRNLIHEGLHPPVLVFVQSKERAKSLFSELIYDGVNVDIIHAGRTQLQRDNVVKAFRKGKIWVLICTELMGRGIDFKGINLVINYDFPQSAISYIHRVGRAGRAGRPGKAITFFTETDKPALRSIATVMKESGCDVPEYMIGMKKTNKKLKRKLENSVPKRSTISTTPKYLIQKKKKLKQMTANHNR
ncbi:DExD-box helicase 52 [Lycorma delicatula]|uniref:DExD-box helicase 52 n=1 Tax=Lycorma delicatula TaxID=130591 RepID=UPI003F5158B7